MSLNAPAATPAELSTLDLGRSIVETASDRQAIDVRLLDLRELIAFADHFVVCHGTSDRHVRAIVDAIVESIGKLGYEPTHIEGTPEGGWILIDYGQIIVHVFAEEQREYYQLERLWQLAPVLMRVQ
ncbi:MAG: ribosome silencing factor [Chloroflexi bacterium]|nr:ribosome silencing factor [Chloroflexota bacterium]